MKSEKPNPIVTEEFIAEIICNLEAQRTDEKALLKSLLYLLAILQERSAYTNTKLYPLSELKDLIHWAMLKIPVVADNFNNRGEVELAPGIVARRKMSAKGKFEIAVDKLFPEKPPRPEYEYDVCISFAGEQRDIAESIATKLKDEYHLKIFYDNFEKMSFWGHDHFNFLYEVYSKKSRYCVILFSKEYLAKNWTNHELKAVQSRILKERKPYLLPILVGDGATIPPEFETIGYLTYKPEELEDCCSQINERVWDEKQFFYLFAEEVAEKINGGFNFSLCFSPFLEGIEKSRQPDNQLFLFILGLIWSCPDKKIVEPLQTLFEYLLFAFPPVASRFNKKDEVIAIKPRGKVRRSSQRTEGALIMSKDFWEPIIERWKQENPQMFSGDDSED